MLFRNAPTGDARPSPEVMQEFAKKWDTWLGRISGQGKFISGSLSLAIVSAITTGLLAFALLKLIRAIKQFKLTTI